MATPSTISFLIHSTAYGYVSSSTPTLPSRIKRVFYMSSEGNNLLHEVFPNVNPTVLDRLRTIDCIIYAMGSLFTSICPSLVLLGIGEIIASRSCPKVLLLNGIHDRETSGFSAACFVTTIADALNRTYGNPHNCLKNHVACSFQAGLAASGALTSALRLMTKAAFERTDNSLSKGAMLFLAISTFFEFLCIFLYAFIFPKLPIVKYYSSKAALEGSKTVTADLAAAGIQTWS
ncbi:unnamed protein product [Camellia sinensis]